MDRILAMSLVGACPGNVFGPGMSAGALESFARDAGRAKAAAEGNSSRGAAAGGTRSASAGSGGKCAAADQRTAAEKKANNGASANVTRSCPCAGLDFDETFCFVDAVVAPY